LILERSRVMKNAKINSEPNGMTAETVDPELEEVDS
jgi:hypothetical protein